jgi:tetratricopeptide (TPR) repeat protein
VDSVINAYPGNFEVKFTNAVRSFEKGRETCKELLPELFSIDTSYPPLHALHAFCNDNDNYVFIHSLGSALQNWSDEPEWHYSLAEKYFCTEQFSLAASHLEKAINIIPDNPGYWQLLGDIKIRERDFDSAKKYFSQAISIFPSNPAALNSLALLNRKLGDFDSALNCIKRAINLEPNNLNYRNNLNQLYLEMGDYDKASKDAKELISLEPGDITPKVIYIKTLLSSNHALDAKNTLANWLIDYPDSIELRLLEAQITYKLTGCVNAIPIISALANKYPNDVEVLNKYAEILIECNYFDEAEKVLQQSIAFNPEQPDTYLSLGRLYRNKGNLDLAISMFSKSLSIDPGIYSSYIELGKTFQSRREFSNAVKIYQQGLTIFSESPILHYNAGIAYKDCKDYKNAETMLRQAAQLDPNDNMIRRQLAGVIALNLVHNLQEPKNHEYRQ